MYSLISYATKYTTFTFSKVKSEKNVKALKQPVCLIFCLKLIDLYIIEHFSDWIKKVIVTNINWILEPTFIDVHICDHNWKTFETEKQKLNSLWPSQIRNRIFLPFLQVQVWPNGGWVLQTWLRQNWPADCEACLQI